MTHKQMSRKGGQARSKSKAEAGRNNLEKARKALAQKRMSIGRMFQIPNDRYFSVVQYPDSMRGTVRLGEKRIIQSKKISKSDQPPYIKPLNPYTGEVSVLAIVKNIQNGHDAFPKNMGCIPKP